MTTWYRTGTASIANGSTAVTGTLTAWVNQAYAGDWATFDGGSSWHEIATVNSHTSITLVLPYPGTTVSGGAYAIAPRSPFRDLTNDLHLKVSRLLDRMTLLSSTSTTELTIGTGSKTLTVADAGLELAPGSPVLLSYDGTRYMIGTVTSLSGLSLVVNVTNVAGSGTFSQWTVSATGVPGTNGTNGTNGVGVPSGGTTGQVLAKTSATDYATAWVDMVRPNLLINGDFQINQRGFAGGFLAAGSYGVDRWRGYGPGGTLTVSGYVCTLTGRIGQIVEPAVMAGVASLASTPITISLENPSADVVVIAGSASGTITAGSGRRSVTLTTAAGDTGNISIALDASGASFSRVKAEVGSVATEWLARPLPQELRLSQRYYQKSARLTITPADGNPYTTDCFFGVGLGVVAGVAAYSEHVPFVVPMRATPTLTFLRSSLGTTAGRWQIYIGGSWVDASSMSTGMLTEQGFVAAPFHASIMAGTGYNCTGGWTASAEL